MTITFHDIAEPPRPSLAYQVGVSGSIGWRNLSACRLTYEDNDPEYIPVEVVQKRHLHVVTDRMLAAMRDMETEPGGRLSGLSLNLYPM